MNNDHSNTKMVIKRQNHLHVEDNSRNGDTDYSKKVEGNPVVDRGYAWLVAAGAASTFFFAGIPLIWVGSIFQAGEFIFVIPCNLLYGSLGPRKLTILGSILIFMGFMLTSVATSVWQIFLSLSICAGLGVSFQYGVALRCVPQWFDKRRATAFGLQSASSPLAGLILPFIVIPVYMNLSHQWIFRIFAFMSLATSAVAIAFLKDQPSRMKQEAEAKNFDFTVLKNTKLCLWLLTGPLDISARYIAFTFLPAYGTYIGLNNTQIAAIAAITSSMNFFGRILLGVLADYIGRLNMFFISMALSTLSVFTIWMFAHDFTALVGFAVTYGFFCGTWPVVNPVVTVSIVGLDKYPSATNLILLFMSLEIVLPVIASSSGAADNIRFGDDGDLFLPHKIVGGCINGTCALLCLIIKLQMNRKLFAKV
ncbi:major facilitator superfamily domain-containing protein [Phascolomyces articulosus]|uniref:Major facilitator superfamily domain-containing protein n=1 Tax=Phascolomyces articulosus TaxID=60185 RepID=A0AAD5K6M9_9FUNG|nr:major facilitator superfamily domain-containing protein [Phascolomyces articulosus]